MQILKRFEDSEGVRQFLIKNLFRNTETGLFDWKLNLPVLTKEISNIGAEITANKPISNKTLFISGSESSYILPADRPYIEAMFENCSFVIIEGAGHWVQADKPVEFIETVLNWINE